MSDRTIRRALLSVWNKDGLIELAQDLHNRGVEILSTGGTLRALHDAGIPAVSVSQFTGHPEIFGGRVKTLHPKLEGAILFRRGDQAQEAETLGIPPIDLVVANLYPFEAVTADPSCDLATALEHIDIGGPTMIRAAAKNHVDVAVIVEPRAYGELREALQAGGGAIGFAHRARWAAHAFAHVSAYDATVATWLQRETPFPEDTQIALHKVQDLRYGENPHQRAAFYGERQWKGPTLARARQLQGKELSYNNILDGDAALGLVLEFEGPAAVIVKHSNPSGAATGADLGTAYERAMACDPVSAFGGILAVQGEVDEALAARIGTHFFEIILAPSFSDGARARLANKTNLRLLEVPDFRPTWSGGPMWRRVLGGALIADWDRGGPEERQVKTRRSPTDKEWADLEFAWRVASHVKSNAIVLARDGATIGIGAGQMSRVDSSELAVRKAARAGIDTRGSVLASDAFFPFRDGLDAAIAAGATAVIQPGGSKRDDEVIAAADEAGLAMVFTGTRHFRH